MTVEPASNAPGTPQESTCDGSRQFIIAVTLFVALVCSGVTSCTRTQVALSSAGIAAILVGTTVGVTYAVKHHHHTLQGCIFSAANGLKLRTSDAKVYALEGDAAGIKVGDSVKLHGSKKKLKGHSTGERVFVVQRLSKDYGTCPASFATSRTPAR